MAVFSGAFSVPGTSASITLQLHVNQESQSIANNTSTLSWTLQAVKGSAGYPRSSMGRGSSNAYVNGWVYSASGMNYNFPSGPHTWVIASGSTVVPHNADGTKTIWCEAMYNAGGEEIGNASCSGNMTLTTIPRATQPTVSPASGDTGSSFTIGHAPATSSFYHDISYSINGGTSFTPIETNIVGTDTSTTWTPPHSLLPNDSTKTAIIRCVTRASSGGTVIGTKDVNVNLTVPSSVKPVVSTVAFEEAQLSSPNMVTLMGGAGRHVRRWSKLKPTVTSSGAGGSSVVSSSVTLAGQTTPSGTAFAEPVNVSGTPSFSATAVDTRGRSSDVYYNTVTVKAYDYPSLPTPQITRTSDAAGLNPSPTGTYLRVTPNASTSKLEFGGAEKNLLEWQIRTRPKGGSWTVAQAWTTATVSGNTIWTTPKVLAGYAANTEYEVEVSIRDLFGKNGFDTANTVKTLTMNVPSEAVFMDWNESTGIGLGRYHSGSGARLQVADGVEVSTGDVSVPNGDVTSGGAILDPIGSAKLWFAGSAPQGWLLLQGQAVSRTTYAALFALLGTTYGAGNGSTTFNLPDMRGRVPVGVSTDTEFDALGKKFGTKTHTLTLAEMPSHNHGDVTTWPAVHPNIYTGSSGGGGINMWSTGYVGGDAGVWSSNFNHQHKSEGGGGAHNNIQPSIAINYIIRAL